MVEQQTELKGYLGARIDALQLEIQKLRSQLLEDENQIQVLDARTGLNEKLIAVDGDYNNKLHREIEERFAFLMWLALFYNCLIIWAITK